MNAKKKGNAFGRECVCVSAVLLFFLGANFRWMDGWMDGWMPSPFFFHVLVQRNCAQITGSVVQQKTRRETRAKRVQLL
jgi:hypothetical protein